MKNTESALNTQIRSDATKQGARLFRNNTGVFFTKSGRRVRTGLAVGSPDLVGWIPTKITPEMIGKTLAVFYGVEAKTGKLKLTTQQRRFLQKLKNDGGVAVVARGTADNYIFEEV